MSFLNRFLERKKELTVARQRFGYFAKQTRTWLQKNLLIQDA